MCLGEAKLQVASSLVPLNFWWRKVPREVLLSACEKRGTGDEAIYILSFGASPLKGKS